MDYYHQVWKKISADPGNTVAEAIDGAKKAQEENFIYITEVFGTNSFLIIHTFDGSGSMCISIGVLVKCISKPNLVSTGSSFVAVQTSVTGFPLLTWAT